MERPTRRARAARVKAAAPSLVDGQKDDSSSERSRARVGVPAFAGMTSFAAGHRRDAGSYS